MQVEVIDPKKTAMIVVDMQNDFVAAGAAMETPAARAMAPRLAEALRICRAAQSKVIYTAHVHRRDGCDMGLFDDLHPPIANRAALVDGTPGVDIYPELAPASGEDSHILRSVQFPEPLLLNRSVGWLWQAGAYILNPCEYVPTTGGSVLRILSV